MQTEALSNQGVTGRACLRDPAHDLSVVEALRRGDEGAFAGLVDQYHPSLRRVARLYVANRAVADEVVQDTWLGVIQGIWAFEGRSSLKTWIFRILIMSPTLRNSSKRARLPLASMACMRLRNEPGRRQTNQQDAGAVAAAPGVAGSGSCEPI